MNFTPNPEHETIREAIGKICARFDDSYWLERDKVGGFPHELHRALAEPILLGGAPRNVAILNGTLAAVVGLGLQLWIPGLVLWLAGHSLGWGIGCYQIGKLLL